MKKKILLISTLFLAFIGGYFNAYSFYIHNGKYAFLQTGTLITLVHDFFYFDLEAIKYGLLVFGSFYLGVILTYMLKHFLAKAKKDKYTHLVILIFDLFMIIPSIFFTNVSIDSVSIISVITLGLVGGSLIESFRRLSVNFASTMMTNNTMLLVDSFLDGILKKEKAKFKKGFIYVFILLSFILGVCVFFLFYRFIPYYNLSILIPVLMFIVLIVLELILLKKNDYSKSYVEDKNLSSKSEILVNHLIKSEAINIIELNEIEQEALEALRKEDLTMIKNNTIAKNIYICHLMEEKKFKELLSFLDN